MHIVNAGHEFINIEDPVKKVERVARICYKSEDKIKDGSAEKMVRALVKREHTAMIEHASLVVMLDKKGFDLLASWVRYLEHLRGFKSYLRFTAISGCIVSGNMRAWRDFAKLCGEEKLKIFPYLDNIFRSEKYGVFFEGLVYPVDGEGFAMVVDPDMLVCDERMIHKDVTVLFTVDRGVSHEIVRHRPASFAQESTRYCNYGKSDVTFIRPCFLNEDTPEMDNWVEDMMRAERDYINMLRGGFTPQEARCVLPSSLKTEIAMTANLKEWYHFFNLRAVGVTGAPHPQMVEVALPLMRDMQKNNPQVFNDLAGE